MSSTGPLILFAVLGAVICAKTRSAAGAVVFSLIAVVLFVATPVGQGVPGAIGALISAVDRATSLFLTGTAVMASVGPAR